MHNVKSNLKNVQQNIFETLKKVGDEKREVEIVAVTKLFDITYIDQAIEAGIENIGENRVQEAEKKYKIVGDRVTWHLVGTLQRNKAKKAVNMFGLIHSVNSIKLTKEINKRAKAINKIQEVLVQVNTSGEDTKSGIEPEKVVDLALEIGSYENVKLLGFMTIGPLTFDTDAIRKSFSILRKIKENFDSQVKPENKTKYLSMGMTSDYIIGIEEGSNMIRIGTALFGPRTR